MAKETTTKNIRITAKAYRGLTLAAALLGETRSALASRAILELMGRDLAGRYPDVLAEFGVGPGPLPGPEPGPRRKK